MSTELPPNERPKNEGKGPDFALIGFASILILAGLFFLLSNMGLLPNISLHNWWALFFLLPIFALVGNMWRTYRRDGRFTKEISGNLFGLLLFIVLMFVFLFNLNWGTIWPVFLILVGLSALGGALAER